MPDQHINAANNLSSDDTGSSLVTTVENNNEEPQTILENFDDVRLLNYFFIDGIATVEPDPISEDPNLTGKLSKEEINREVGVICEFPRPINLDLSDKFRFEVLSHIDHRLEFYFQDQLGNIIFNKTVEVSRNPNWQTVEINAGPQGDGHHIYKFIAICYPQTGYHVSINIDNFSWGGSVENTESCQQFCNSTEASGIAASGEALGRGASAIDIDGDGDIDIFQADSGLKFAFHAKSSKIHLNDGAGNFTTIDPVEEYGIDIKHLYGNWQALFFDADNDDDPDLLLVNGGYQSEAEQLGFYRNDLDVNGRFTDITSTSGISDAFENWWSAAAGDINNDGRLDLIVTSRNSALADPVQNANSLLLYQNLGNNVFEEISATAGLPKPVGDNKNALFFDFDNDGCQDILISKWLFEDGFMAPTEDGLRLFRNENCGTEFSEVVIPLSDDNDPFPHLSFAVSVLDYDQDGFQDIYMGRFDSQDYMIRNNGDGTFSRLGSEIGIDMSVGEVSPYQNTMGLAVADIFDHDGYPDILIGCGNPFTTTYPVLLRHNGNSHTYSQENSDMISGQYLSRSHGAAAADFDGDGDMDFFWNRGGHGTEEFMSEFLPSYFTSTEADQITFNSAYVKLIGQLSNRDAVGARIEIEFNNWSGELEKRYIWVKSADGFMSQNSRWQNIPLGQIIPAEASIRIYWPSGAVSHEIEVQSGDRLTIYEMSDLTSTEDQLIGSIDLYPNPVRKNLKIEWSKPVGLNAILQISNTIGETVMLKELSHETSGSGLQLDVSGLSPGTYFISVLDETGIAATGSFTRQ